MGNGVDSNIFQDLAALNGAGIAMLEAAQIVGSSHSELSAWPDVIHRLAHGSTLAKALGESGLISRYEQEIISAAEFAGRTEQALTWLAASYEKRYRRVSQLRYKLILPFAVLLIGVTASSILTLFKNPSISVFSVLIQAACILAVVFVATKMILNFLQKDASNFIANIELFRFSRLYKHLFEHVFFGILLWNIKSGIDFKTAFLRISKLVNSKTLKQRLELTSTYCEQGLSVADSIKKAQLPITIEIEHVLKIAQASGRWEYAVEHYLKQQQIIVDLKVDSALEWAPRIYYLVIVLYVSSIIL